MNIGWDMQSQTGPGSTGLGQSSQLLFEALQTVVVGTPGHRVTTFQPDDRNRGLSSVFDRVWWEQARIPARLAAARPRLDVCYSPAFGKPLLSSIPHVVHVHDLIPVRDPGQFTGFARWFWSSYLPACWRRCRAITVSNASQVAPAVELLGIEPERVFVVPYYVREVLAAPPEPQRFDDPYFFSLSSHEPRKNISLAIKALGELKRRGFDSRLVCGGKVTAHTAELRELAAAVGVADRVDFPGYLSDEQTAGYLRGAVAMVFVSRLEGYGMPPQEAQAAGCPVILGRIPSLEAINLDPERWQQVAEEDLEQPPFVELDDYPALADNMQRMLEDGSWRSRLVRAGLEYQRTFNRTETGRRLLEALTWACGQMVHR